VAFDADVVQDALHVVEPVDLVVVPGQPDSSTPVPSRVHAGLLLDHLVQVGGVPVDLGHVEVADEVGDQAGRVPGGPGGELVLLDQDRVGPAFVGEEVEEADAHGAAADDRYSDLISHARPPANPACMRDSLHAVNCGLYGNR